MKYVFDLHQAMISENLILVYEGEFTQEITKSILSMVERNMDSVGEDSAIKRKVFSERSKKCLAFDEYTRFSIDINSELWTEEIF